MLARNAVPGSSSAVAHSRSDLSGRRTAITTWDPGPHVVPKRDDEQTDVSANLTLIYLAMKRGIGLHLRPVRFPPNHWGVRESRAVQSSAKVGCRTRIVFGVPAPGGSEMLVRERTTGTVGNVQRAALRKLTSGALEEGCTDLGMGRSESDVCYNLGLPYDLFDGILESAIEEVLWERGHISGRRAGVDRC